jgi:tetratricopeptide (TPR) repeat protein
MKSSICPLFVLLLTLLFFQISFSNERISIQQGRFAAERICLEVQPLFPGWISVRIDSVPTIYYNFNSDTVLYLYEIQNEGKKLGYCSIGAYDDLPVLIEATPAIPPHKNLKEVKKKLAEYLNINENDIKRYKLISPGDHFYYIKFFTPKGNYFIDLKSFERIEENYISSLEVKINNFRKNKNKILHDKWDSIFAIKFKKVMTGSSKKLSGVEPYTWYRGCAPTSLTMALNYKGKDSYFSNLRHSVSDFNWNGPHSELNPRHTAKQLVDHFADYFGLPQSGGQESDYGVPPEDQPAAVISIANSHGYNFSSEFIEYFTANRLVYEINNDRPIKYGIYGHAQCGYGYAADGEFIYFYNTWDRNEHVEQFVEQDYWNMNTLIPNIKVPQQFSSIQDALNYIHIGEAVIVSSGIYYLYDNVTVPNGKTLQLNSGVTLKFASSKKLTVNGILAVNGTFSNYVTIQSSSGTWYGIEMNATASGSITYCTIQNAQCGIRLYNTSIDIWHCSFSDNNKGIKYENQGGGFLWYNTFENFNATGIECVQYSCPAVRSYNGIWDQYYGVKADNTSLPDLGNYAGQGYNSIYNVVWDIYSTNPASLNAQYNWWGSETPSPSLYGNVVWQPYLDFDPVGGGLLKSLAEDVNTQEINEASMNSDTTGVKEFEKAYSVYLVEDYGAALNLFDALVTKYPDFPVGRQSLAFENRCLENLGRSNEALTIMNSMASKYSGKEISGLAQSIAAGHLVKLGDYQQAITKSEQILQAFPDKDLAKYALYDLGTIYWFFLADQKMGENYYRQLIAKYPDDDLSISALSTLGEWQPGSQPKPEPPPLLTDEPKVPSEFRLDQNYPNPFNPETVINYQLAEARTVTLLIYNLLGKKIRTLVDEEKAAGSYSVHWDGKDDGGLTVASGLYGYVITAGEFRDLKKMVLVR